MYRKSLLIAVMSLAFTLLTALAGAQTFSFQTLDNPTDPTFNQLLGINDSASIVGYFGSGVAGHPNKGYKIQKPYTTYQNENFPGSAQTQMTSLSDDGNSTCFFATTNTGTDANFGCIRLGNGTYIEVNNPLVSSSPAVNQLLGINQSGIAAGFYNDAAGNSRAYTYSMTSKVFTPVAIAGATSSAATGINNGGLVSGLYTNAAGVTQGFVKRISGAGSLLVTLAAEGSKFTQLLGINDGGIAVGFYNDSNDIPHGVYYNFVTGQLLTVNDPDGVNGTVVNGLNNKGQLVGFYIDAANNTHGMIVTVTP
jgi:hypothetical protein